MKKLLAFACVVWVIGWNILWAALPATDNFNYAAPLSGSWTNYSEFGGDCTIDSTNTKYINSSTNTCLASWNADSFNSDHYSQAVVTGNAGSDYDGVAVRVSTAQAYECKTKLTDSGADSVLRRWNSMSVFDITSLATGAVVASGTLLRLEANGSALTCYDDGVSLISTTDSTHTGGAAGIVTGNIESETGRGDDWEGGNLSAARRRQPILGLLFLGWNYLSPVVHAQSSFRLYLVPRDPAPVPPSDLPVADIPQYQAQFNQPNHYADLCSTPCEMVDYWPEPGTVYFLVRATTTALQHTSLTAQPDVLALPANLNSNPSAAQVNNIQTILANRGVPSTWINTGLTYRQIARRLEAIFQFARKYRGLAQASTLLNGRTLSATIGSLPAGVRSDLQSASDHFGWDRSGITTSTTIEQAITNLSSQWRAANGVIRIDQ